MNRTKLSVKTRLKRVFSKPFYFLFFSAYPVLALLSNNISQIHYTAGIRPLLAASLISTIFFLFFRIIFKNWHRAAFAVAMLALLFFSYGHVYGFILNKWETITNLPAWMASTWGGLAVLAIIWATWRKSHFERAAPIMNLLSMGLTLFAIGQTTWWSWPHPVGASGGDRLDPTWTAIEGKPLPDIYYIIPDSYGRADALDAAYDYDNSDFINSLEELGFYVADCSQSNYARTDFSLASSLNMSYVQDLSPDFTPDLRDPHPIWDLLQDSVVRRMLEGAGYKTVAFATGFSWSQLENADIYLEPPPLFSDLTAFEVLLLQTTPARHLSDLGWLDLAEMAAMRFRERTLFTLDELARIVDIPGPKFVFAHIITPHPPFVFGPNGEKINPGEYMTPTGSYTAKDYRRGYLQAIPFLNRELERILPLIIENSTVPPIIVLQGDHGAWALTYPRRIQILNAYYLPGENDALYPSISPVNSFRVIFNSYFGQEFDLLEDKSYSAPRYEIYDFSPVPYNCTP